MRNNDGIFWGCLVMAICLAGVIAVTGKRNLPNLECSVDDTLTFVAYNVTHWNMRDGILEVVSREDGELFAMSRILLLGETCREVAPSSREVRAAE